MPAINSTDRPDIPADLLPAVDRLRAWIHGQPPPADDGALIACRVALTAIGILARREGRYAGVGADYLLTLILEHVEQAMRIVRAADAAVLARAAADAALEAAGYGTDGNEDDDTPPADGYQRGPASGEWLSPDAYGMVMQHKAMRDADAGPEVEQ